MSEPVTADGWIWEPERISDRGCCLHGGIFVSREFGWNSRFRGLDKIGIMFSAAFLWRLLLNSALLFGSIASLCSTMKIKTGTFLCTHNNATVQAHPNTQNQSLTHTRLIFIQISYSLKKKFLRKTPAAYSRPCRVYSTRTPVHRQLRARFVVFEPWES